MGIHVEFVGNLFVDGREDSGRPRWRKTTLGAGIFEVEVHSCVRLEKDTSAGREQPVERRGSVPHREVRYLYRSQSLLTLETNCQAGERPELRVEEQIFVGEKLNSAGLQPLVRLIEARGEGLLRSAREGDELRTGTKMRALLSALASGRAEIEKVGQREGWSVGSKKK